jgi:signal transduction histidine kinase
MTLHRKMLRWAAISLSISMVAIVAGTALYLRSAKRERVPNQYLLDSKSTNGWTSFGGTWSVLDGVIRDDSRERGAKIVTGSASWRNYAVDADLESLSSLGDIGLIVRSTSELRGVDAYNGYYVGLRSDNSMIIGRGNYGWAEHADVALGWTLLPMHWYHLKVVAVGCDIYAEVTDQATGKTSSVSMNDDLHCAASGRIGLRSVGTLSAWKNIHITPASPDDLRTVMHSAKDAAQVSTPFTLKDMLNEFKLDQTGPQSAPLLETSATMEPIDRLRLASSLETDKVAVRGKVILTRPALFVQDATGGTEVLNADTANLDMGDQVLVEGTAVPEFFSSSIKGARITKLWPASPDPPFSVTVLQAATGAFADRLIEVRAHLMGVVEDSAHRLHFDFNEEGQQFQAILQKDNADHSLTSFKAESILRIRGVCVTDVRYTRNDVPFAILLRSSDDLAIINGPPWWSARNLIAGATITLILFLLGCVAYIRVEQWRVRAVVEERQRLAHELHDTLAQSFAGIGFQLRAIRKKSSQNPVILRKDLDIASELVRQGHQEARRSISTLRTSAVEHIELLPALFQAARRMVAGGGMEVETFSIGEPRRISLKLTDVLFRVGQEAIANALRHASATKILLRLEYLEDALQLTIEDDGIGFLPEEAASGGFGIEGIRSRVQTVSGTVLVRSSPGNGTQVLINTPLAPSTTMLNIFAKWRR